MGRCLPPFRSPSIRLRNCGLPSRNQILRERYPGQQFEYLIRLDGTLASRGGIPLIELGKLIGAIGCSGSTDSQDEVVCKRAWQSSSDAWLPRVRPTNCQCGSPVVQV